MALNQSLPPILFQVGDRVRITYVPGAVINISEGITGTVISVPQIVARMVQVEVKLDDGREIWWPQENLERIEEYLLETPQALGLGPELVQDIPDSPTSQFQEIDPRELKPHPLNPLIYGEEEDISDLMSALDKTGWIKTIVVTSSLYIISGHRRVRAAIALNWSKVPVEIKTYNSELEKKEALLLENQYRQKTIEQRVREGKLWLEIESEKAALRRLCTQNNDAARAEVANLPPLGNKGKARDLAALKVAMKGRTYQKAAQIVNYIDNLALSNPKEASQIKQLLNEKSVDAAYQRMKEHKLEQHKEILSVEPLPQSFPYQVGDFLRISAPKSEPIRAFNGFWGIVVKIYEGRNYCDFLFWKGVELQMHRENLKPCSVDDSNRPKATNKRQAHGKNNGAFPGSCCSRRNSRYQQKESGNAYRIGRRNLISV